MKTLADKLDDIAMGNYFDGAALWEAYEHEKVTCNDKKIIMRYMYGAELSCDRFRLQDIAINLRSWE